MDKAGTLDQRITLREYTTTQDALGGTTKDWADFTDVATVWAGVKPGTGREAFEYDRENATVSYTFTIRYRDDVDERHAILWGGNLYNIRSAPLGTQRNLFLEIQAERGVAGAG